MSIDTTVNDFLTGGGGKSVFFKEIGDSIKGTVISAEAAQQTDMDGTPKSWDDGNPMMQVIVTLQTDLSEDDDDDGKRKLYVKGSKKPESQSLAAAVAGALTKVKAKLEVGGTLAVKYIGDGVAKTRGFNAPKLYTAAYKAPDLDTGGLLDEPAPVAAAPAASDDPFDL